MTSETNGNSTQPSPRPSGLATPAPDGVLGLRHAALPAVDLARATAFYRDVLGFRTYYDGDADWTMVRYGGTSLSLVLAPSAARAMPTDGSHPAHLGFTMESPESVDALHRRVAAAKQGPVATPRWHRDKSYGFYFQDTEGNNLEAIFIPVLPIAGPRALPTYRGLVLFAHGSADPAWRRPLDRLAADCRRHFPHTRVGLAFLERAEPTLEEALLSLFTDDTVTEAIVVPVFFSAGLHVANDLPPLVEAFRRRAPDRRVRVVEPVGHSAFFRHGLLEAVAEAME
jgi:sirohydrochlorin cobaltochelatase